MQWLHNLRASLGLKEDQPMDLRPGINVFGTKKIRLGMKVCRNGVWTDVPDEISDVNGAPQ